MSKDDILQAFRLVAMGRCNHPLQDELAEKLAALFAEPAPLADADADALRAKRRKKAE